MKILCFGSLNIDYTYSVDHFVKRGETLSSGGLKIFSGGKGLNQSVALSRAGAKVFHAGAIGEDGIFLLEELKNSGVDTSFIIIKSDIRTGHAIIQNSPDGDNCILLFGGANRSITEEDANEILSAFEKGDMIVLQNEISCLEHIIKKAKEKEMSIVLNPSPIDEVLLSTDIGMADILVLNEIEAGCILGKEVSDGAEGAKALSEKFPGTKIVLTMGKNGSYYCFGNEEIHQDIFPVKAVDTTAAGDTFTGYFLAGISEGMAVKKAMELASKASSIAVTKKGASPSIPKREEVVI